MAAATKAQSVAGIERFIDDLTKIREIEANDPGALDKANFDEAIEHLGNDLSIPPGIIRDDDDVAKIRQGRQQQQAAAQKAQQMQAAASTAKDLSSADTTGGNALSDLIDRGNAGNMLPTQ